MLTTVLVVLAAAPAPIRLAAPEWTTVNMPADLGAFYAGEFARVLRSEGLEIITSRDMQTLLGLERQKELMGCSEGSASCVAELGAALGCERVLVGQLAKLDDSYRGSIRVMSTVTGKSLAEEPVEANGQKALVSALEEAAHRIAKTLKPPEPPGAKPNLAWVPIAIGGALGAGAAVSLAVAGSNAARISQSSETEALQLADTGKVLEIAGWTMAGVGTAAIITGAILLATGAPPKVTPSVTVSSGSATLAISGVFP